MKIKLCPICGKTNTRGGNSKFCSGDCKRKADKIAQKRKNQEMVEKRLTTMPPARRLGSGWMIYTPCGKLDRKGLDKGVGYGIIKV